jgi:alpha-aminoadipate carrier protein LysW
MVYECKDCGANLEIPNNFINGEIIGCGDCGLDYVIESNDTSNYQIKELLIEGEDWGE